MDRHSSIQGQVITTDRVYAWFHGTEQISTAKKKAWLCDAPTELTLKSLHYSAYLVVPFYYEQSFLINFSIKVESAPRIFDLFKKI